MKDDWKIAKKPNRWAGRFRKIYVSLNARGEIVLNRNAFDLIRRPASVALLYDEAARRIAVKYPVSEDGHFFRVGRCGRGRQSHVIRAARMMRQFGLQIGPTQIFKDVRIEDVRGHPALVLDLKTAEPLKKPEA